MKVKNQALMGIIICLLLFQYLSESLITNSPSLVTRPAPSDSVLAIPLQDTTKPTWDEIPTDQVLEFGNPFEYDVNASDASGIDHYWINDTQRFTVSDDGVIASHSIFCWIPAVGLYGLEVRAYDPYNNFCNATFKLTVQDTSPPTWGVQPQNQILEFGEELNLTLWVFEMSQVSWAINDTTHFSLYVLEGNVTAQITSINDLESGKYGLNISITDFYGNAMWANITITILPPTNPLDFNSLFVIILQAAGVGVLAVVFLIIILVFRRRRN